MIKSFVWVLFLPAVVWAHLQNDLSKIQPKEIDVSQVQWPVTSASQEPFEIEGKTSTATLHQISVPTSSKVVIGFLFAPSMFSFEKNQIPHFPVFVDMLLEGGSGPFSFGQLVRTSREQGLSFSTHMVGGRLLVRMEVLKEDLEEGLRVLTSIIMAPKFNAENFDEWKKRTANQFSELIELSSVGNQEEIMWEETQKSLYGENSVGSYLFSSRVPKIFDSIIEKDLIATYSKVVIRNNLDVILVGKSMPGIKERLAQLVKKIPEQPMSLVSWYPERPIVHKTPKVIVILKPDMTQSNITLLRVIPKAGEFNRIELATFKILENVFSGTFVSALGVDRVSKELRVNSGLSYSPHGALSTSPSHPNTNGFVGSVKLQTPNERLLEGVDAAQKVLDQFLTEGVTQEEYDASRFSMMARLLTLEPNEGSYFEEYIHSLLNFKPFVRNKIELSVKNLKERSSAKEANQYLKDLMTNSSSIILTILGYPSQITVKALQDKFGADSVKVMDYRDVVLSYR